MNFKFNYAYQLHPNSVLKVVSTKVGSAIGNPGSVPAQPFLICKFIPCIVQNVK